jgi:hypothetical protein
LPEKSRRFDTIFQIEVTWQTSEDSPKLCPFCCWVLGCSCAWHSLTGSCSHMKDPHDWLKRSTLSSCLINLELHAKPNLTMGESKSESSSSSSPTSHTRSIVTSAARISLLPKLHPTKPWSLCFPKTIKAPEIISYFSLFFFWVGSEVFQAAA